MKKNWRHKTFKKYRKWGFRVGLLLFILWYSMCLPQILFKKPISLVIYSEQNKLLAAHVANDGQWRFPKTDSVNSKFKKAIITYEDKRFYDHIGVDIWAVLRALRLNLTNGEVVSGASTLSMQVIRLSRNNPKRTVFEKITEMFRATRLEMRYNKQDILKLYASHAPFGGNVVGIDAAAWKYFGKSQNKLTWAEACMLAVLPNAPSLIHLGKNRDKLLSKRNFLLDKLLKAKHIDSTICKLSKMEPLPQKPQHIPQVTPHLLDYFLKQSKQGKVLTSIDFYLQNEIQKKLNNHARKLEAMAVYNASVLVVEVKTGKVKSYIGNTSGKNYENAVDMLRAKRSTGSILKPFLFAEMLDKGQVLPNSLVQDIPVSFYGYEPENYHLTYDGVVPASEMVSKSLNIPAVNMLHQYGVNQFLMDLKNYGFHSVNKSSSYYGLPLILGGAEVTPWELANIYNGMSQKLTNQNSELSVFKEDSIINTKLKYYPSKTAIYQMYEAMLEVKRPRENKSWKVFGSPQKIAWKTGTSFGGRDGWAVGCNPKYTVIVWTGNADGEGRPNLTGFNTASPILFDIFGILPQADEWFHVDTKNEVLVCQKSGYKANRFCVNTHTQKVTRKGVDSKPCNFCKSIALDSTKKYRVAGTNYPPMDRVNKTFFVLQPQEAFYYQKHQVDYAGLPPALGDFADIYIEYPQQNATIYLPKVDSGKRSSVVFKATSTETNDQLFWTLDNEFVGATTEKHAMALKPAKGKHTLVVINSAGNRLIRDFKVVE